MKGEEENARKKGTENEEGRKRKKRENENMLEGIKKSE